MPIRSKSFVVIFSLGAMLTAQVPRSHGVALKNWPAPLYWQPTQAEADKPEIRTPTPDAATPAGSLVFVAMTPCRVVDTRTSSGFTGPFGQPSLSPYPGSIRTFPIQSSTNCSIPSSAQAYSFNVTLLPNPLGTAVGYLTLYPTTASPNTPPTAVTLDDYPTGDIRNNAAVVPAGISNGSVSAVTNGNLPDLVIDINGYYAPSTGITLAQGTASAPSLSFSGDAGTGIFSSGAGALNFTTGGTNALTIQSNGDLNLTGNLRKSGFLFLHDLGGTSNVGVGVGALAVNTGTSNTATGGGALAGNTSGYFNTASGFLALANNTTGTDNTATGYYALYGNTTGTYNTANGDNALYGNTTGIGNTATGYQALSNNSSGASNTASGTGALMSNTTAGDNTAIGYLALQANTTGASNTAVGEFALGNNTSGAGNTAIGLNALAPNTTGAFNIALGFSAGRFVSGSNNIDIGNGGTSSDGTAANSGVIRIGTSNTQTSFFAAGISGVTTGAAATPVIIDMNGQLGTMSSSRRFKEDIQDMDEASSGVLRLRPVTYRYRKPYADGSKPLDYGLIAEEVAEIYPDLVIKNADGQVETVQYQKLTPMLVNEVQKQHTALEQRDEIIRSLQAQVLALQEEHKTVDSLRVQISALQKALETLASKVQSAGYVQIGTGR